MEKLYAKQNRRAKQWATIENFANTSQCVRNLSEFRNGVAKLARNLARLRIWQGGCEFGNVVCEFGNVVCEVGNAVAKLAMRNFAKVLKFFVRSEFRK